jgi:L-histidine N-alpha-methyltransferase
MSAANILIDSSQFPGAVHAQLLESLRSRRINHKFHYDSYKQAQKWLALHEGYSPARRDLDCERIYDEAFATAAAQVGHGVHVIGLGCGGGQKEARLLRLVQDSSYWPCDVSLALVLTAREAALKILPEERCSPVVCDLAEAKDLASLFPKQGKRIVTFFGMIPNFEPSVILPKLASVLTKDDLLLFSANLAPGEDYGAGVRTILSQYDNELTKEWLLTVLLDLGAEREDGQVEFSIEQTGEGYFRVVADFVFTNACEIRVRSVSFTFTAGEKLRLFFSYRYQPQHIVQLLKAQGISVVQQFITRSEEEGVFLCEKN